MSKSVRGFHVCFMRQLKLTPWWALSPAFHAVLLLVASVFAPEPADPKVRFVRFDSETAMERLASEGEINEIEEIECPAEIKDADVVLADEITEELGFVDFSGGVPQVVGIGAVDVPFIGLSTSRSIGIGGGAGGRFGGRGGYRSLSAGGIAGSELLVIARADGADPAPTYQGRPLTQGTLFTRRDDGTLTGECPLVHTNVRASIAAFLSQVELTQRFENPSTRRMHAVYVFPLPRNAAVTDFLLTVDGRTIRGMIREREEAKRIYEAAKAAGRTASLVSQERPNIFTQEVANLPPGEPVDVTLTYLHPLRVRDGAFEFVFPMTVGPRYTGGQLLARKKSGTGVRMDSDRVPDASRISPPTLPPGARCGRDISLSVEIDAGVTLESVKCPTHRVMMTGQDDLRTTVELAERNTIPNRDFVLRYRVAGSGPKFGVLAHRAGRGGFFALMAVPKAEVAREETPPREMVFVLDVSGSMSGPPLAKSKAVVERCLAGMSERDTFRVLQFSNQATGLSDAPLPVTPANVAKAKEYLANLSGGGGTEMLMGIKAALEPEIEPGRMRVVCFLTDGFIGSEPVVLSAVKRLRRDARLFALGVGSSVNRYLLDKLAEAGRGAVQYVLHPTPPETAAEMFWNRLGAPYMTDLEIDYGSLPVERVFPEVLPDLYEGMPILIVGRYRGGGSTMFTLRGQRGGRPFSTEIPVTLPHWSEEHDVLAQLWARCRVETVMDSMWGGVTRKGQEEVAWLGLHHGIVTAFTSYVAVDSHGGRQYGDAREVTIAVPLPDGVVYSGVYSERREFCEIRPFGLQLGKDDSGLLVIGVVEGSPAEDAGIESGDRVLAVNGIAVESGREAETATGNRTDGLVLTIRRGMERRVVAFEGE